jgi:outer membrane lipoprotein-sorting protein
VAAAASERSNNVTRIVLLFAVAACSACPSSFKRSYPPEPPANMVAHVRNTQQEIKNLRADTKADVWIGSDRANVTVNILAAWGGKLRFQAENPNNSMAADLASDGSTYCFLDANSNCGGCGPATAEGVGQLLGIVLEPDDIVAILFGSTPVIEGKEEVTWDSSNGWERITITGANGYVQHLALDGAGKSWDVRESEIIGPEKKSVFKIRNKEFHVVKTADGRSVRVPGASLLEQRGQSAKIVWRKQELNLELQPDVFTIQVPEGLPECGAKK